MTTSPTTDTTLTSCDVSELVEAANRYGIHYHLSLATNAHYQAGQLMVWNCRDPKGQMIVDAMRARRDEVVAFLREHRPPAFIMSEAEERYRRDVLHEEDIPLSELAWGQVRCLVFATVWEAMDAWHAHAEDVTPAAPSVVRL